MKKTHWHQIEVLPEYPLPALHVLLEMTMRADMQGFQLIMNFIVMPLYFLSGAIFPLDGLPKLMSAITKIDPLSYGIDAFRHLLIDTSHFPLATDLAVLSGVTVVFLALGSYFFTKIEI